MRRWNGWGDDSVDYPINRDMFSFLNKHVGEGKPAGDAGLEGILASLPPSRLPRHRLVTDDPMERLMHSRGQSLPDWIALRSGNIGHFPDGVAFPENNDDVKELIDYAQQNSIVLIPYGGGTSVVGHVNVTEGRPALTVSMRKMNRLLHLDEKSRLAVFQAGVSGPELEEQLRGRGYLLGHYPQSFEYSTLGGWVASRSSGQQSLGYGRIEKLFAGGRMETPRGTLNLPVFPASGAGPDLREYVLGSEGRYGILTEITVRVRELPEAEMFGGIFFPDFTAGVGAVRDLAGRRLPLTMLRLSTSTETATNLAMTGKQELVRLLEKYLSLRGAGKEKCLLIFGVAGSGKEVGFSSRRVRSIAGRHGGVNAGKSIGREWHHSRFKAPYLRNSLWEAGYAVDTFETAVPWAKVEQLVTELNDGIGSGLRHLQEKVHVLSHLSHVYTDGCSIYTTYVYRLAEDWRKSLARWQVLKGIASETIVRHGGTISHQHGVGTDHKQYLPLEKGSLGMELLRGTGALLDSGGIMNPGKLY